MDEREIRYETETLLCRLIDLHDILQSDDSEWEFWAFLAMPKSRREQMVALSFKLHQRITFALATRKIHRSLDERTARVSFGEELNNGTINE